MSAQSRMQGARCLVENIESESKVLWVVARRNKGIGGIVIHLANSIQR